MACLYFQASEARLSSRAFYFELEQAAHQNDPEKAEKITRTVMLDSLRLWKLAERDPIRKEHDEIGTIR